MPINKFIKLNIYYKYINIYFLKKVINFIY